MSSDVQKEWPLWEVFVRSKAGLDHKHCGSLHAPDANMAIQMARDVYTRRQEGCSVWVVQSDQIVASLISLAHDLGLSVTAEGVETTAQADRLRAGGCDTAQGWLYAQPITWEAVLELLADPLPATD